MYDPTLTKQNIISDLPKIYFTRMICIFISRQNFYLIVVNRVFVLN